MPPGARLPERDISAVAAWIKSGAVWPSATSGAGADRLWSFKPLRKPPLPAVKNRGWVRSPVDAFVLAKLEAAGLQPAPPADRRRLIRRATFDLTGLPPTPEETEAFVRDAMPDADTSQWVPAHNIAETIGFLLSETGLMMRETVIKLYNKA